MTKKHDFTKLRALLIEQEKFPVDYTVKFIGKNSSAFTSGISRFESEHPGMKLQSRRESSGRNHLAMTYVFSARNADHIIAVLERVALIEDLTVIL